MNEANRIHPHVWWWIKADGVDLVSGLGTSVKGVWSGDVDLADGSLQKAYEAHKSRLDLLSNIESSKQSHVEIVEQLTVTAEQIVKDIDFICSSKLHV